MKGESSPTVAIACQGGGSHTAFTAGVLDRLLEEEALDFEVVGLSGTSGGAICAFATWFGLASVNGSRGRARRLLSGVWNDLAARGALDAWLNAFGVGVARAGSTGLPLPSVSPYDTPGSDWGRSVLRGTLEEAVDPEELEALLDSGRELPRLDIGAVDVQRGTFTTFTERDVSHDAVLASAAVPNLFQAAPVTRGGETRYYWDGLFSQNPPLSSLFRVAEDRAERADELWIVQINPHREDEIPTDLEAIADRRNELGGNLSVNQELGFLRLANEWATRGELEGVYDPIEVKTIDLEESRLPGQPFDYATKLDRSPEFLDRLWAHGRDQAERFLDTERHLRTVRSALESMWASERGTPVERETTAYYEIHLPTNLQLLGESVGGKRPEASGGLGSESALSLAGAIREAVPDLEYSVEEMVADGDRVATRWSAAGTHTGPLLDVEPTGEPVRLCGLRIDRLEEGRFAETWLLLEQWSLLRQIAGIDSPTAVSTVGRVSSTPIVTQLSAPAENEEVARSMVSEVWNRGRRDRLDRLLGDGFVLFLDSEADRHGLEEYWEFVSTYRAAFPDLELTIEDTVSQGDKIVLRLTLRGTHEGPLLGVEPTGREVTVDRLAIYHLTEGRIIETGIVEDTLGLLRQLGASPSLVAP